MDKWATRQTSALKEIIIHQSLSSGSLDAIRKYHMSKGNHITPGDPLPNIAYHVVIDFDGKVVICNDFSSYTFHTYGANKWGIGVCVLGNFVGGEYHPSDATKGPTTVQIYSLGKLVEALRGQFPTISKLGVKGHFDYGKAACPGDVLKQWVLDYRMK